MSCSTEALVQNLPSAMDSAPTPGTPEVDETSPSECLTTQDDGVGSTIAQAPGSTPDANKTTPGATDVQPPFSLADHDVEPEDHDSDAPLLLRCPKGGLLRLGFIAYDSASSSEINWEVIPLTALVPELPGELAGGLDGMYSGGGLLLMQKLVKQQHCLVVCNPTSKTQHQLPPMMDFFSKPEILGIYVDFATASYKIPVIQRNFNEKDMDLILMQEYDSNSDSWEFAGQWRNRYQVEPIGAAYVNGTLFFLTYDRQAHQDGKQQRAHHIYYLNDNVWERLELPLCLGHFGFPAIFEHRGKLMLAGGLHGSSLNVDTPSDVVHAVRVWEHEWSLMSWVDKCNMPSSWLEELYKFPTVAPGDPPQPKCTLEVAAGSNYLFVSSSNGRVIQCDIANNNWTRLPKTDVTRYADGSERLLILERWPDMPV